MWRPEFFTKLSQLFLPHVAGVTCYIDMKTEKIRLEHIYISSCYYSHERLDRLLGKLVMSLLLLKLEKVTV